MPGIHSSAIVHPTAVIPNSCTIAPYSIIDEGVVLGENVLIGSGSHVYPFVSIGKGTQLHDGVIAGSDPQDKKYQGENTRLVIGDYNVIREYVTLNKGTAATGLTQIGSHCLIMAYAHVAHDCRLGDHLIIANSVQMGGHVELGSHSVISGMTGIHQFTKVGEGAFVGGGLRVAKDIFPFTKALGDPLTFGGVNEMGLNKLGFSPSVVAPFKKIFRELKAKGILAFDSILKNTGQVGELKNLTQKLAHFYSDPKRPLLF